MRVAVTAAQPTRTDAQLPDHCEPGRPWPLGATLDAQGVNFAVYSSVADQVEVCLFDRAGTRELRRLALPCRTGDIWHGLVARLPAGSRYGLRVHGPYQPQQGLRCNPHKLLLDPYARALDRPLRGGAWQYAYTLGGPARDLAMDTVDNAAGAAKCVVLDTAFDWGDDRRPATPMADTVLYEVHVRGFTQLMDEVPQALRGTFSGLASEPALAHFKRLGVTAIELLPVHAFNDERRLIDLGLANYWGYNTVAFFAPEPRYCADGDPDDFKRMVKALHARRTGGDPGRGLQPQLRGQPPRAHAVPQGHRQPVVLPPGAGPPLLRRRHRHRQHAGHQPPGDAAAGDGQPALLGTRRCTSMASASTSRRRSRATAPANSTTARPSSRPWRRTRCCGRSS